jgi:hypothetical protein
MVGFLLVTMLPGLHLHRRAKKQAEREASRPINLGRDNHSASIDRTRRLQVARVPAAVRTPLISSPTLATVPIGGR